MSSMHVSTLHTNLGQVDQLELRRILEGLVRPCESLRFEPKRKREGQAAAAAAVKGKGVARAKVPKTMKALHQSRAAHFLGAVSHEMRKRRFQIRDVFRDVDKCRSGRLGKLSTIHAFFLVL